jgi:8-oxo-dGTP pyrophosphatase MutT (NUDIX family)
MQNETCKSHVETCKLPPLHIVKNLMAKSLLYCVNCGDNGHIHKNCNQPILSYGIICYNKFNNKFLLIQRKHSIAYVDFIRGKYSFNDINFLIMLLENMSNEEKQNILTKNYIDLWNELWINRGNECPDTNRTFEFRKAKNMYELLVEGLIINNEVYTLKNMINSTLYDSTSHDFGGKAPKSTIIEWGFPKGRRNKFETNIACAFREFFEETKINLISENETQSKQKFTHHNNNVFIEEFIGNNGLSYKYTYFLIIINYPVDPFIDQNDLDQISEVGDVQWFSYQECFEKLVCQRKQSILKKIYDSHL